MSARKVLHEWWFDATIAASYAADSAEKPEQSTAAQADLDAGMLVKRSFDPDASSMRL